MTANELKSTRQELGCAKFNQSKQHGAMRNGSGVFWYPTGFGKTYSTILILKKMLEKKPSLAFIVLVHRDALREQWNEILNANFKHVSENYAVMTPNEILASDRIYVTDFLIADELHRYYGTEFIKVINGTKIRYTYNLGLSATPKDESNVYETVSDLWPIIDYISENEAISKGWVSQFYEYNFSIELSEPERISYENYSNVITKHLGKFGKEDPIGLSAKCLQGGRDKNKQFYTNYNWARSVAISNGWSDSLYLGNPENIEINEIWNPHKVIGYAKALHNAIQSRKSLLYDSSRKKEMAINILQRFKDLKAVCFSQSTIFVDNLTKEINRVFENPTEAVAYHSNMKGVILHDHDGNVIKYKTGAKKGEPKKFGATTLKKHALDSIKNNTSRILVTASALDDGLDIPDLRLGLITSGTSGYIQQKQRSGRVKRIESSQQNDTKVLIVNLYFKNTVEEQWLFKRQKANTNAMYYVSSVEEIIYDSTPQIRARKNGIQLKIGND